MPKIATVIIVETDEEGLNSHTYQVEFEGEFMPHRMFNENWVTFDHVISFERLVVVPDHADSES